MVSREKFLELLSAVHNVNNKCEPADEEGENFTKAALNFAHQFYRQVERARPGEVAGMLLVISMLADVEKHTEEWVDQEIERGWAGEPA